MTPLYFGASGQRLFGAYEPAHQGAKSGRAAVLCNPVGNEYVHAHRTMRSLASRLSKDGYHVLRFDYYGTGDAAGDSEEGNPHRWYNDIEAAMSELRDMTGAAQINLIGMRLGANLAAQVAARRSSELESLVLWEPLASRCDAITYIQSDEAASATAAPADTSAVALPSRTLVLLTSRDPQETDFGKLEVGHVPCPSPWVDRFFEPEVIPVDALAFIVKWMNA